MEISWILSGSVRLEKADWSAIRRRKFHRTLNLGVAHVHVRQLRAVLERLDVACGVAVASTNGESDMRHETARERGRIESGQFADSHSNEWKIPQEKRTGPQPQERTF